MSIGAETIASETVLWAAGVAASPLGAALGVPVDRAGRVRVQPDLTIPGASNVFVIGDLASLDGDDGRPLPGVAQVAIQMGQHARAQHSAGDRASAAAVRSTIAISATWPRSAGRRRSPTSDGSAERLVRLARLAVRPHPQSDWLPQPPRRAGAVDLGLLHAISARSG